MTLPFESWTKEALIQHIQQLEHKSDPIMHALPGLERMKSTYQRFRPVALRVAYFGWPYRGFAAQPDEDEKNEQLLPTVESLLFQALERSGLVNDRQSCRWSRCGRTDKGVSAFGQVVSLHIRTKQLLEQDPLPTLDSEFAYVSMLNRLLPDTIRILAWRPTLDDFDARFSCTSRTYKYFFESKGLDVEAMHVAAQSLVGEHDFRHFCKRDTTKIQTSFKRCMMRVEVKRETEVMAVCTIQASAFLYHQIRCIMAILFMVGQGLESGSIVAQLLDLEQYPQKPVYDMASELPLVLYDCQHPDLDWSTLDSKMALTLLPKLEDFKQSALIQSSLFQLLASDIRNALSENVRIHDHVAMQSVIQNGAPIVPRQHPPLCRSHKPLKERAVHLDFVEAAQKQAPKIKARRERKRKRDANVQDI